LDSIDGPWTKPGFEPRKIEMRVEHSNHFTIRTLSYTLSPTILNILPQHFAMVSPLERQLNTVVFNNFGSKLKILSFGNIFGNITTIFNDFLHYSSRKQKNLPKSINEHNFLLLSFIFSFTHTIPTLVNILKTTVALFVAEIFRLWFLLRLFIDFRRFLQKI
jgi:hypothetical protein